MSENILIAGVGRNIENSIPFLKETFDNIASAVDSCAFAIYENNSSDLSPNLLREWSRQDPRVHTICDVIPEKDQLDRGKARTWDNKPCRLELIVAARNKLLEIVRRPEFENFEIVLMLDLDIPQTLPTIETLEAIYTFPNDAAAVFSYGVNSVGKLYDLHAYRDDMFPFGPEIIGEDFFSINNQKRYFRHTNRLKIAEFHPVQSAFNGAALYRRSSMIDCSYSAHPTKELDKIYREQATRLGKSPSDWIPEDSLVGGSLQGVFLFGTDGFFYRNNAGYNFPIVIGHSTFHAALAKKGKLLLRPSWLHYSGHLGYNSWDEILANKMKQYSEWIKRKFKKA